MFQAWWATHVFVLETSTRYARPLGSVLGLPARPSEVGFLGTRVSAGFLSPAPVGREGPQGVAKGRG